jgi:hypothetical protein
MEATRIAKEQKVRRGLVQQKLKPLVRNPDWVFACVRDNRVQSAAAAAASPGLRASSSSNSSSSSSSSSSGNDYGSSGDPLGTPTKGNNNNNNNNNSDRRTRRLAHGAVAQSYIGKRIVRDFTNIGYGIMSGVVVDYGMGLWGVKHDDGDVEDLDEAEVIAAIDAYANANIDGDIDGDGNSNSKRNGSNNKKTRSKGKTKASSNKSNNNQGTVATHTSKRPRALNRSSSSTGSNFRASTASSEAAISTKRVRSNRSKMQTPWH